MGRWLATVAKVSFYAGGQEVTSPRWLDFAGQRWPVEVLWQAQRAPVDSPSTQRLWVVKTPVGFFRLCWQEGGVRVEQWHGPKPPTSGTDLLG